MDQPKLEKAKSAMSTAYVLHDMNKAEIDSSVKDLLYDQSSGHIKQPENGAILLQLPGTLPFTEIKPHAKNGLEEILERLSNDE